MTLARYIRTEREKRGHSQPTAAAQVGVAYLTWGRWERGQVPTLGHAYKLADYLGVTLDALRPYVEAA